LKKIDYPPLNGTGTFYLAVNYEWTLDQVTSMTATYANQTKTIASNIRSFGGTATNGISGLVRNVTHGNGRFRHDWFDTDGRLFRIATDKGVETDFDFDPHDRITERDPANAPTQTFFYDDLDRLNGLLDGSQTYAFTHDANGNREADALPSGSRIHSIATGSNRLEEIHTLAGALERRYGYKATGEVTSIQGIWTGQPNSAAIFANGFEDGAQLTHAQFTYDSFNRLIGIDTPWLDADFKVAATGMRIAKTINGQTTRFVYGMNGQLLHEHDKQTEQRTYHLYLHGKPIAMLRDGQLYWVHTDQLGRPELLADQSGTTKWRAKLEAFDRAVIQDQVGGYHLGFPGQYHDTETGFIYNIFRYYDATTGRYLQPDPIGLTGGINLYVYADGNPITMIDPNGLEGVGYWNSAGTLGSWPQDPCLNAAIVDSMLNLTPLERVMNFEPARLWYADDAPQTVSDQRIR